MSRPHYRAGACRRCEQFRVLVGRSLCNACTWHETKCGTLHLWPRVTVPMEVIVEEFRSPARVGETFIDVAVALGVKPKSAERQYYRAKRKGLVS
jgi:hypothetical protein